MAMMRYREALNEALREEMARDETVMLMGEDIGVFNGAFKVTAGLLAEFGEKRVRDTPISENTIVGMGVGAAMTGLRPVVELMTINFSLLALDQIVNHAAHIHYMFGGQARVPLVVRMPQGAGVTIVGISRMAITAQRAAKTLSEEHEIEAEVIDPRTLRPLDLDTILT